MAWIVRNTNGVLVVSNNKPERFDFDGYLHWGFNVEMLMDDYADTTFIQLPSDADEKLIGRHLAWEDNPVEI